MSPARLSTRKAPTKLGATPTKMASATVHAQPKKARTDKKPASARASKSSEAGSASAEVEHNIRAWNYTWTCLLRMLTKVVPFTAQFPDSPFAQRTVLEELTGRVCDMATDITSHETYKTLLERFNACEQKLHEEREQNALLTEERDRYKQSAEELEVKVTELTMPKTPVKTPKTPKTPKKTKTIKNKKMSRGKTQRREVLSAAPRQTYRMKQQPRRRLIVDNGEIREMLAQDLRLMAGAVSHAFADRWRSQSPRPKTVACKGNKSRKT